MGRAFSKNKNLKFLYIIFLNALPICVSSHKGWTKKCELNEQSSEASASLVRMGMYVLVGRNNDEVVYQHLTGLPWHTFRDNCMLEETKISQ
jgi:hypothetical protein